LYSAFSETTLDLDMLDKSDHEPIKYKRVNEKTGREVAWKNIVKGYKIDDSYVVLDDKDFEKAAAEKTKRIAIKSFVRQEEIDPIYFDNTYFLEPSKGGAQSYVLLRNAMKQAGMVGLGSFVLRNREHLCVIKLYKNALVLTKIHFEQELRDPEELNIPAKNAKQDKEELEMAVTLIQNMEKPFDISKNKDEYTDQLLKFIKQKAKGKPMPAAPKAKKLPKEVSSLMEQLRASLGEPAPKSKTSRGKTSKARPKPAKRRAKSKS
jgi:DNA end-binding protein Ku